MTRYCFFNVPLAIYSFEYLFHDHTSIRMAYESSKHFWVLIYVDIVFGSVGQRLSFQPLEVCMSVRELGFLRLTFCRWHFQGQFHEKKIIFWCKFRRNLFLFVQLTGQHWFRWLAWWHWTGHWCIYASPGLNELTHLPPGQNGHHFGRRQFQMHFLEWKWQNSDSNFTEIWSQEFNWQ